MPSDAGRSHPLIAAPLDLIGESNSEVLADADAKFFRIIPKCPSGKKLIRWNRL
jgi:hypothetical protein